MRSVAAAIAARAIQASTNGTSSSKSRWSRRKSRPVRLLGRPGELHEQVDVSEGAEGRGVNQLISTKRHWFAAHPRANRGIEHRNPVDGAVL